MTKDPDYFLPSVLFAEGVKVPKRGVGAIFCLITTILYSVRFINATLYTPASVVPGAPLVAVRSLLGMKNWK